jgi:NADP-dependent 3-hydroxy acid dehydrogenase YdfG
VEATVTESAQAQGARVLVVGGSGVLGAAIANELGQRGARLVLSGRDAGRLSDAAQVAGAVASLLVDIRDDQQVAQLVSRAVAELGGLDGVMIASGVVSFGPVLGATAAAVEDLMLSNVVGPLAVIRAALPHLGESKGWVCAVTGVVAERPVPGMAAYSASKAALSTALKALRAEVRSAGIAVIDVRPPHTETGLATRPIEGHAPSMPQGLDPAHVAAAIVTAALARTSEVPAASF